MRQEGDKRLITAGSDRAGSGLAPRPGVQSLSDLAGEHGGGQVDLSTSGVCVARVWGRGVGGLGRP